MGPNERFNPLGRLPWKRLPIVLLLDPCNVTTERSATQVRPVFDQITVELLCKSKPCFLSFLRQDELTFEVRPSFKCTLLVELLLFELLRSIVRFCPRPAWPMRMRFTPLEELCVRFPFGITDTTYGIPIVQQVDRWTDTGTTQRTQRCCSV